MNIFLNFNFPIFTLKLSRAWISRSKRRSLSRCMRLRSLTYNFWVKGCFWKFCSLLNNFLSVILRRGNLHLFKRLNTLSIKRFDVPWRFWGVRMIQLLNIVIFAHLIRSLPVSILLDHVLWKMLTYFYVSRMIHLAWRRKLNSGFMSLLRRILIFKLD